MTDNTNNLDKSIFVGGTEHIRDSDYGEALVEGVIYIGDVVVKGTAETQVIAGTETGINFKGIAVGQSIRQSDTANYTTVLVVGTMMKYLKPTGGRVKVRAMCMGYDTGSTVPSGSEVWYNGVGSTIGASDSQLGDFYADPAQVGDNSSQIGRLSKPVTLADSGTNSENAEIEMWY